MPPRAYRVTVPSRPRSGNEGVSSTGAGATSILRTMSLPLPLTFNDPQVEDMLLRYVAVNSLVFDCAGLLLQATFTAAWMHRASTQPTQPQFAIIAIASGLLTAATCLLVGVIATWQRLWFKHRTIMLSALRIWRQVLILCSVSMLTRTPNNTPPSTLLMSILAPALNGLFDTLMHRTRLSVHVMLALLEAATTLACMPPKLSPVASLALDNCFRPHLTHLNSTSTWLRRFTMQLAPAKPHHPLPAANPTVMVVQFAVITTTLLASPMLAYSAECFTRAQFISHHTSENDTVKRAMCWGFHLRAVLMVLVWVSCVPLAFDCLLLSARFGCRVPSTWLLIATVVAIEAFMRLWFWVAVFTMPDTLRSVWGWVDRRWFGWERARGAVDVSNLVLGSQAVSRGDGAGVVAATQQWGEQKREEVHSTMLNPAAPARPTLGTYTSMV